MIAKTEAELKALRECGKRLAHILESVSGLVAPGVSTKELDNKACAMALEFGDTPAFLNYIPEPGMTPYPAGLCVSINDEIVHGIPKADRVIKDGDIAVVDFGLNHEGFFTDSAYTVIAGKSDAATKHLVETTRSALEEGLKQARTGNHVGDISNAISEVARKAGIGVFRDLAGHGVGRAVHEEPMIPNYGKRGRGLVLQEGLVIAIEPIFGEGDTRIRVLSDGHTYATIDQSRSAHFEHTVIVRKDGPEILTLSRVN